MPTVPAPKLMAGFLLPIIATLAVLGGTKTLSEAPTSAASPAPITPPATVSSILGDSGAPKTTTTAPKPIPADAQCPQWWPLAVQVGWPVEQLPMLDRVIWRESRCLPEAWNGHDAGLTQINQIHTEFVAVMGWSWPEDMHNPEYNLRFALKLWQGSGWRPWGF